MTTKDKTSNDTAGREAVGGKAPAAESEARLPVQQSSDTEVSEFVARMRSLAPSGAAGRGRLIFAMDATMSRRPTWDMALNLQADMFQAVREVGGLDVQLIYFRGIDECRASKWVSNPDALARLMTEVECHGGYTQIRKVLSHARREAEAKKVNTLVYVGDAMEEDIDDLCSRAGELALLGVPMFLFQEGSNSHAARAFGELARLTKGAHCRFNAGSARQLRELLTAVAVYAAGGRLALEAFGREERGAGARLLLGQLRPAER